MVNLGQVRLLKDRMDITGARWGLERAEAILKVRSLLETLCAAGA
jgi:hypothetical protein